MQSIRLLGVSKAKLNEVASRLSKETDTICYPLLENPFNKLCKDDFSKYIFAKYVVDLISSSKNNILVDNFSTVLVESEIFRDKKYLSELEYQALQKLYVERLTVEPDPDYFFYVDCTYDELIKYQQLNEDSFIASIPFSSLLELGRKYDQWFQTASMKNKSVSFARIASAEEALQIILKDKEKDLPDKPSEIQQPKSVSKQGKSAVKERKEANPDMPKEQGVDKAELIPQTPLVEVESDLSQEQPEVIELPSDKLAEFKLKVIDFNKDNEMKVVFITSDELVDFKASFDNNESICEIRAVSYFEGESRFYSLYCDGEELIDISDYTYLEDALESLKQ